MFYEYYCFYNNVKCENVNHNNDMCDAVDIETIDNSILDIK